MVLEQVLVVERESVTIQKLCSLCGKYIPQDERVCLSCDELKWELENE